MATACFTGHRPNKLPGGYNYYSKENLDLGRKIRDISEDLILNHSVDTFICGGALGVDQMAFMVINKLKIKYPNVKLILAMPFEKQDNKWLEENKKLLQENRKLADKVVLVDLIPEYKIDKLVSGEYHPAKMQKRNEYMVDRSDFIIAIWNGDEFGGTFNCIKYAKKYNKEIKYINIKNVNKR